MAAQTQPDRPPGPLVTNLNPADPAAKRMSAQARRVLARYGTLEERDWYAPDR